MSCFLPAPSMIVVFSFSMRTRLAVPSIWRVTFSSLMPRSSAIIVPAVRTAISCSIALRRSPKPGAFTAATFRPPRRRLTTSVAKASPSTSSATMTSGLPERKQFVQVGELLLVDQDVGVIEFDAHLVGVGDEVGRDVAAVELHAL